MAMPQALSVELHPKSHALDEQPVGALPALASAAEPAQAGAGGNITPPPIAEAMTEVTQVAPTDRSATSAVADAASVANAASVAALPAPEATSVVDPAAVVPLTRLQGVQRVLAQTQKDLTLTRAEAATLRDHLTAAQQRAASEYADRLRATESNIVPQLICGDTLEQVDQSLANSKAAFSAAQQAYARTLPTPAIKGPGASALPDADQNLTPLQLLRAGLSQTINEINR